MMIEILSKIKQLGKNNPGLIAINIDHTTLTYQQLVHRINLVSKQIRHKHRQKYIGICYNSPIYNIIQYFALHDCGYVPIVLSADWTTTYLRQVCQYYRISELYTDDGLETIEIDNNVSTLKHHNTALLHIGFTSGTTGMAKGYYRDEASWIASFRANESLMLNQEKTIIAPGPFAHSLTLYACLYAFYTGRTFIGQTRFDEEQLAHTLEIYDDPSALFIVPTMIKTLLSKSRHLKCLTSIFSSGDKLNVTRFKEINNLLPQVNVIEFFGSSETSFISYNLNQTAPVDSVGKCFNHVQVNLLEKDDNNIGLLQVKSDMTFQGYVDDTYKSDNEWITTGDYVSIDNNNYLYLQGRKDDKLIVGGNNVYPKKIESMILSLPYVKEAIIVGKPHDTFGEIAVLLYTATQSLNYQLLRQCLLQSFNRYEVPSILQRVSHMEYTASGKIARQVMKEKYLKGVFK